MDNSLDDELTHHIKGVFDNYEDGSADAGWLLLREKFPEKDKRPLIMWWYAAAALLLFTFAGLWFNKRTDQPVVSHINRKSLTRSKKEEAFNIVSADKIEHINTINPPFKASILKNLLTSKKTLNQKIIKFEVSPSRKTNNSIPLNSAAFTGPGLRSSYLLAANRKAFIVDPSALNSLQLYDKSLIRQYIPYLGLPDSNHKEDAMMKMIAADNLKPSGTKSSEKAHSDMPVVFGAYAATYFNYAKGSSSQVNVGAGFSSDIKLSSNIRLSTGISIAQNSLDYDNNTAALQLNSNAIASSQYAVFGATAASISTPTPTNNRYNATLVGLDIPINFKYRFNPSKSDTYIAAGVSSGTYINETYHSSYTYSNPLFITAAAPQQTVTNQHFNSFDLAKTINIAFGVGYPLGKNRLVIEPFLKYPISGLGAQNIRFGASGINLKINFGGLKK